MNCKTTRFEALKACLAKAGTQERMAADLGVTQPTISRMLNSSKQLPAEYVITAERLYGVSRHDLRPDIYPRETMTDRRIEERFCGIDRQLGARQTLSRGPDAIAVNG